MKYEIFRENLMIFFFFSHLVPRFDWPNPQGPEHPPLFEKKSENSLVKLRGQK